MDTNIPHYNAVCLGSSPLLLLEAIHQRRCDARTLVIEKDKVTGGAWRDLTIFGIPRVEVGPHFLTFDPIGYDYLSEDLGLNMQRVAPDPLYVINTAFGAWRVPYQFAALVSFITVPYYFLKHRAFRSSWTELQHGYVSRIHHAFVSLHSWLFAERKPYLNYFRHGTPELMDKIMQMAEGEGVNFQFETQVKEVEKLKDGRLKLNLGGRFITTDHLYMTCHQFIDSFKEGDVTVPMESAPVRYSSIHMLIRSSMESPVSFIHAKGDPYIFLFSDLTSFTKGVPAGHRLVVLRFTAAQDAWDEGKVHGLVQYLAEQGFVAPDARLAQYEFSDYTQNLIAAGSQSLLQERMAPALTVWDSTLLTSSIGRQVKRWREQTAAQTNFARVPEPLQMASSPAH